MQYTKPNVTLCVKSVTFTPVLYKNFTHPLDIFWKKWHTYNENKFGGRNGISCLRLPHRCPERFGNTPDPLTFPENGTRTECTTT